MKFMFLLFLAVCGDHLSPIQPAPTLPVNPGGIGGLFKGPNSEIIIKGPDGSVITAEAHGGEVHTKLDTIIVEEPSVIVPLPLSESSTSVITHGDKSTVAEPASTTESDTLETTTEHSETNDLTAPSIVIPNASEVLEPAQPVLAYSNEGISEIDGKLDFDQDDHTTTSEILPNFGSFYGLRLNSGHPQQQKVTDDSWLLVNNNNWSPTLLHHGVIDGRLIPSITNYHQSTVPSDSTIILNSEQPHVPVANNNYILEEDAALKPVLNKAEEIDVAVPDPNNEKLTSITTTIAPSSDGSAASINGDHSELEQSPFLRAALARSGIDLSQVNLANVPLSAVLPIGQASAQGWSR